MQRHKGGENIKPIKCDLPKELNSTKRTDGRYPLRIGCIGLLDISDLKPDRSLVFKYLKDNIGEDKNGFLITSSVQKVEYDATSSKYPKLRKFLITVTTRNSIYTFEELE